MDAEGDGQLFGLAAGLVGDDQLGDLVRSEALLGLLGWSLRWVWSVDPRQVEEGSEVVDEVSLVGIVLQELRLSYLPAAP